MAPGSNEGADGGSAGPLRAGKNTTYEGGIRVPFIARWPGHIPSNRTVSSPAMNIDLYSTFTKLAGLTIETPARFDGKDISPMLLGTGTRNGHGVPVLPHEQATRVSLWQLEGAVRQNGPGRPAL